MHAVILAITLTMVGAGMDERSDLTAEVLSNRLLSVLQEAGFHCERVNPDNTYVIEVKSPESALMLVEGKIFPYLIDIRATAIPAETVSGIFAASASASDAPNDQFEKLNARVTKLMENSDIESVAITREAESGAKFYVRVERAGAFISTPQGEKILRQEADPKFQYRRVKISYSYNPSDAEVRRTQAWLKLLER